MKRGFTLIELLGVIILISLLMIIVLPNIVNSVRNSSNKTDDLTLQLIYDAADLYISNHKNDFPKENGNKYIINLKDLIDEDILASPIKISHTDITNNKCIQVTYEDDFNYELKNIGSCIENEIICRLENDTDLSGTVTIGDKYKCEVKYDEEAYNFYILATPTTDTVNLIMDRNICEDGTFATSENKCLYAWYEDDLNNNYGPITAMTKLNNATLNWREELMLNTTYNDEAGNFTNFTLKGKARLPFKLEVSNYSENNKFLYDCLEDSGNEYQTNKIVGIRGYWVMSSTKNSNTNAWYVRYSGIVSNANVNVAIYYGIRPVITLPVTSLY